MERTARVTAWCSRNGCKTCPKRKDCPPERRKWVKARLDKTATVGRERLRRAARALSDRWLTPYDLGCEVMRKSIRVSGNRMITKMRKMGMLLARPTGMRKGGYSETEYRLSEAGKELLG